MWTSLKAIGEIPIVLPCLVYARPISPVDKTGLTLLSAEEMLSGYKLSGYDQEIYFSAHICLRQILARFTGLHACQLDIAISQWGKPYLSNHALNFNVSHTSKAFLIGIANAEIGIDMEEIQPEIEIADIMDYAFSRAEQTFCRGNDTARAFTQVWTLKEAYLKARGTGLTGNLSGIDVIDAQAGLIGAHGYHSHTFECPQGEMGSIVCAQPLTNLIYLDFT